MDILERIHAFRKARNMSVYELAKRTGISRNTIYRWQKENYTPSLDSIKLICEQGFNITLGEFFATETNSQSNDEISKLIEKWTPLTDSQKQMILQLIDSYKDNSKNNKQ